MKNTPVIQALREVNEEFKRLEQEHRELDEKILLFNKKSFLSSTEEVEKKRLQKLKLLKKDMMTSLIMSYKKQIATKRAQ
ncbi:MAG TPA: DUF465 domain-containing protein [Thermodesulfovibrionia bacterium]|nr:DUF465 domain-containing protein [Thermodesulfovibrionia bacterium]